MLSASRCLGTALWAASVCHVPHLHVTAICARIPQSQTRSLSCVCRHYNSPYTVARRRLHPVWSSGHDSQAVCPCPGAAHANCYSLLGRRGRTLQGMPDCGAPGAVVSCVSDEVHWMVDFEHLQVMLKGVTHKQDTPFPQQVQQLPPDALIAFSFG
eukprot:scaffold2640_cov376-Prasinococcus_capsulatus_cf.AAC.2